MYSDGWRLQCPSVINRSGRQKINKDRIELNTINRLETIDIYRFLHPAVAEYTFFTSSHGTLTGPDHILGHKTYFNKFKRVEIIQLCLLATVELTRNKTEKYMRNSYHTPR